MDRRKSDGGIESVMSEQIETGAHWPEMGSDEDAAVASKAKRARERGISRQDAEALILADDPRLNPEYVREVVADSYATTEAPVDETQERLIASAGGLLARIVGYILGVAARRQPWLALAAGLSALSVVFGQKLMTSTGTATNLYVIGLCRSGGGKEAARQANKQILRLAGGDKLLGPDGISSGPGMFQVLKSQPVILFQIDEFGRVLSSMNSAKAEGYMRQIITALLQLWGSTRTIWKPNALADAEKNISVEFPCVSMYGTTVAESLWAAVTRDSMGNGLFGRLLIFDTKQAIPPLTFAPEADPPADLIAGVRQWVEYTPGGNTGDTIKQPRVLPYSPASEAMFRDFAFKTDDLLRSTPDDEGGAVWARAPEKAAKLALIHAGSLDFNTTEIGPDSMAWAIDLTQYLTVEFLTNAKRWLADNGHEELGNRLFRIIEAAGPRGITQRELTRKSQWLKNRDRVEIINDMQQAGRIRAVSRETNGRTAVVLMLA